MLRLPALGASKLTVKRPVLRSFAIVEPRRTRSFEMAALTCSALGPAAAP
jgi:hypothetical protein